MKKIIIDYKSMTRIELLDAIRELHDQEAAILTEINRMKAEALRPIKAELDIARGYLDLIWRNTAEESIRSIEDSEDKIKLVK